MKPTLIIATALFVSLAVTPAAQAGSSSMTFIWNAPISFPKDDKGAVVKSNRQVHSQDDKTTNKRK